MHAYTDEVEKKLFKAKSPSLVSVMNEPQTPPNQSIQSINNQQQIMQKSSVYSVMNQGQTPSNQSAQNLNNEQYQPISQGVSADSDQAQLNSSQMQSGLAQDPSVYIDADNNEMASNQTTQNIKMLNIMKQIMDQHTTA